MAVNNAQKVLYIQSAHTPSLLPLFVRINSWMLATSLHINNRGVCVCMRERQSSERLSRDVYRFYVKETYTDFTCTDVYRLGSDVISWFAIASRGKSDRKSLYFFQRREPKPSRAL